MTKIKNKNRGEAIKDHSNKLADHADAIGEVRRAIEKEIKDRDETDDVFSQQFTDLVEGITKKSKNDRLVRNIILAGLKHAETKVDYLHLPWWRRAWLTLKGETPWSKRDKNGSPSGPRALEAPIGEQSSTSNPMAAPESSCTKSSDTSPTTPRSNTDTSKEDKSSKKSSPSKPKKTVESDSVVREFFQKESPPTGGTGTPTDS